MNDVIPDDICGRIEAFTAHGKTGKIVLNVYHGKVVSGELIEHFKVTSQKNVDIPNTSQ